LNIITKVRQAKLTDIYDSRVNSIGVNPLLFKKFLKNWKSKKLNETNFLIID